MHTLRTLFAFLACALLAGCTAAPAQQPASPLPVGTPVPFAVLLNGYDLSDDIEHEYYEENQLVFTSLAQAESISPALLPEVIDALRSVDFDRHTAILFSMGRRGDNGSRVETRGLYRMADKIESYVTYWHPSPEQAVGNTNTVPFQIVVVPRGTVTKEGNTAEVILHKVEVTPVSH